MTRRSLTLLAFALLACASAQAAPKKKNPSYQEILLLVDDATGRVDSFVVLNADGSTNQFVLTGVVRNGGLTDKEFVFVKPKGFTEIEG